MVVVAEQLLHGHERHAAHDEVADANVCRSPCVVSRFASCAFLHVEGTTSFTRLWVSRRPSASQKT